MTCPWRVMRRVLSIGLLLCLRLPTLAADANMPPNPLKLTAPQQQKLSDMENASQQQARGLTDQIRHLRDRLSQLYGTYTFDTGEVHQLNQQINRVQGQLLELRLSEQRQLRSILTPDQFAQLQSAIRRHGPGEYGHPPGGDGPGHHHHGGFGG